MATEQMEELGLTTEKIEGTISECLEKIEGLYADLQQAGGTVSGSPLANHLGHAVQDLYTAQLKDEWPTDLK